MNSEWALALINKPAGITSFNALKPVKTALPGRKIGHAGTLDRFARGLLLALTGKATRLNPLFTGLNKVYRASVCFGSQTDTLDPEGRITETSSPPTLRAIEAALPAFVGEIEQIPPRYSAVHLEGQRAYKRALRGEDFELKPRRVTIDALRIIDWRSPVLTLQIECGKGFYVRSLARDLGRASGSRAYLSDLQRTGCGPFDLSQAVDPRNFNADRDLYGGRDLFKGVARTEIVDFSANQAALLLKGTPVSLITDTAFWSTEKHYLVFCQDRLLGFCRNRDPVGWRVKIIGGDGGADLKVV